MKSMMNKMLQEIRVETLAGPYITVVLGTLLFVLGIVRLRRLAAGHRHAEVRQPAAVQAFNL
jgi:hypothetical protein